MAKYRPFQQIDINDRQWPNKQIEVEPIWCSVDLRDGNQALPQPMNIQEKIELFELLLKIGFKEIEVGFPSASQIEFDFTRILIEKSMIPNDVYIQVLTQSREHLIERTIESLKGARKAIFHLYNSTSEQQRRITFKKNRKEVKTIATRGTKHFISLLSELEDCDIRFEYSPESFTATELDYALEVCNEVIDLWNPSKRGQIIINLPATVELSTPNIYADQIEWISRKIDQRDGVIISLHTHNDRGTGTAATELGLLAGADRVEGTLFGNGERTGNVDLIMIALNMFSQGIDISLNLKDIPKVRSIYESTTRMTVHDRHPYGGNLVFTAFSGSHQDAISKGMAMRDSRSEALWDVPYLPIDPADIGRRYEPIIRINSQSGKGGVAYILEQDYGLRVPRSLQPEFGAQVTSISDTLIRELSSTELYEAFMKEYVNREDYISLFEYKLSRSHFSQEVIFEGVIRMADDGTTFSVKGLGNGPMDAFMRGINEVFNIDMSIAEYEEQAISTGNTTNESEAAAYILLVDAQESRRNKLGTSWGVGIDTDSSAAHFMAILSALNRFTEFSTCIPRASL